MYIAYNLLPTKIGVRRRISTHGLCFGSLMFHYEYTNLPFKMLYLRNAAHRPGNKTRHDRHHGGRKSNCDSHQIRFPLPTLQIALKLVRWNSKAFKLYFVFTIRMNVNVTYTYTNNYLKMWCIKISRLNRVDVEPKMQVFFKVGLFKMLREQQHPRPAEIRNVNVRWVWPFHTVIHFIVNCIMPPNFKPYCDFLNFIFLAQVYHGIFQSSLEHTKNGWAWSFYVPTEFMVLCITQSNFRLIPEILK